MYYYKQTGGWLPSSFDPEMLSQTQSGAMKGIPGMSTSAMPGISGIASSGVGAIGDILSLFGPNASKKDRSKNIGTAVGSTADTVAGAFGIPTGGAGRILGQLVGTALTKNKVDHSHTPSGNTAGYWRSYSLGGRMPLRSSQMASKRTFYPNGMSVPPSKKVQSGGFYGANAPHSPSNLKPSAFPIYIPEQRNERLERINSQYNLPKGTLQALALLEGSRLKTIQTPEGQEKLVYTIDDNSRSRVGAEGPFQITSDTAIQYGLDPNERTNFDLSADTAAKILSDNLKRFGNMEDALRAYNMGPTGYQRYLDGQRRLPTETNRYVDAMKYYHTVTSGTKPPFVPPGYNKQDTTIQSIPYLPNRMKQRGGTTEVPRESTATNVKIPIYTFREQKPQRSILSNVAARVSPDFRHTQQQLDSTTEAYNQMLREKGLVGKPLPNIVADKSRLNANRGNMPKSQFGGPTNDMIEIEGDEYVYRKDGVDDQNFKMLDNTGKQHVSPYGFLAKGKPHGQFNEGGIKVKSSDAYIASKYLGVNGKKSGKGNPSVASLMVRNGGKVLAKGAKNNWDKFGVNKWNPGAVNHHLQMMDQVQVAAELGKIKENLKQQGFYKNGGYITASTPILSKEQVPNLDSPFAK